jgi:hypothetical protein
MKYAGFHNISLYFSNLEGETDHYDLFVTLFAQLTQ